MPRPDTQKETLNQLWDTVIGTNGAGLCEIVKENRDDIVEMKTDVAFIKGKVANGTSMPFWKKMAIRSAEIGVPLVILAIVVLMIFGEISFTELIDFVRAARGN